MERKLRNQIKGRVIEEKAVGIRILMDWLCNAFQVPTQLHRVKTTLTKKRKSTEVNPNKKDIENIYIKCVCIYIPGLLS